MSGVWLVASGGYEMEPLATFDDRAAAQEWADRRNLDRLAHFGRISDAIKAEVYGQQLPHNPRAVIS